MAHTSVQAQTVIIGATNASTISQTNSTARTVALPDRNITVDQVTSATTTTLSAGVLTTGGSTITTTAGTAGQVLTSNGAGNAPTFQAAGSSTPLPKNIASTCFETSTRFGSVAGGGGSNTYDTNGLSFNTSSSAGGRAGANWVIDSTGNDDIFAGSPIFTCRLHIPTLGSDLDLFVGLGWPTTAAGGITFTDKHIGFKITRTASGTASLFATQANGTTETASSALLTISTTAIYDLYVQVNGTGSVDYYYRTNGGALSSATNLTTNIPSAGQDMRFASSNKNVASATNTYITYASYQR